MPAMEHSTSPPAANPTKHAVHELLVDLDPGYPWPWRTLPAPQPLLAQPLLGPHLPPPLLLYERKASAYAPFLSTNPVPVLHLTQLSLLLGSAGHFNYYSFW